ncbi:MAG: PKD domain-containing protein [Flavobacteriales bacterium]|nr:PKD domain-containing protein [Flavobacteriales bacterium]
MFTSILAQAQLLTNSGKEFWFAFPETYDKAAAVYWVNITSNGAASGTVSIPGKAWTQNFSIAAGQVARVNIPSNFATNIGSDILFNTAIRVTSNIDVVVFAITYHQFRHEASLVLPNEALGTRYRAITYQSEIKSGLQESEFCIVAANDTAEVVITPKGNIAGGHAVNVPYTVKVPPNYVYQAQALAATDDLTGTLIEGKNENKFSVYAGNVWSTIVCTPNSDPILEGMFPTNTWGRDYFVIPTPSVNKDYVRILADQDSTLIFRDGVYRKLLNAGEFYADTISTIRQYTSNRPIAAAHFLVTGQGGCTGYTNTDPSMIILNATEQMFLDSISFFAVDTSAIDSHFVHVLTRTPDTGKVVMDGGQVSGWTVFSQTADYAYKTERVQPGSHRLETTGCGFIAYSMGIGNAVSYGYATGASLMDLEKDISYTNFSGSDTICKDDSIQFKSLLRGNVVSYKWYFGDGDSSDLKNPTHSYSQTGTYYVKAYVVYECVPYDTILDTLVIPEFSSSYNLTTDNVSCFGEQDGWASISGTFLKRINWDSNITHKSIDSAWSLPSGNYTVTMLDSGGCARDTLFTITQPPVLAIDSIVQDSVLCFGDSTGKARVYPSGGVGSYAYSWNNGQTNFTANSLALGAYRVTVSDTNGCQLDTSITVLQPDVLSLSGFQQNVLCFGDSTGMAKVEAHGGVSPYLYSWKKWGATVLNDSISQLNADTFRVQTVDFNGCQKDSLFVISEPSELKIDSISLLHNLCFGDSLAQSIVSVSGGTGNYTYAWSPNVAHQSGDTAYKLLAGNYSVTVSDSNSCVALDTFTITQPSNMILGIAKRDVMCFGDSSGKAWTWANGGTGAYIYAWGTNARSQTTDTASFLKSGTYQVQVRDANGCLKSTSVVIAEPTILNIDSIFQDSVLCFGDTTGRARVYPSGGTGILSYHWSNSQSGFTSNSLSVGLYRVTITDANGCQIDTFINVLQPAILSLTGFQKNVLCFGGSNGMATVSASGGVLPISYRWNNKGTTVLNDSLTQLAADTFRVMAIDKNGCKIDSLFTITQPALLKIDSIVVQNNLCHGDSTGRAVVFVTGGVGNYIYSWSPNVSRNSLDTAFSLVADTFVVYVGDGNACYLTDSFFLTQPPSLKVNISSDEVKCFGDSTGKAWVWGLGGITPYTYLWGNAQTTDTVSGLNAGNYYVELTDKHGCKADTTIYLNQPDSLNTTLQGNNIRCFQGDDGWIKLIKSGGVAPYTFLWAPNSLGQGTDSIFNLTSGSYSVLLVDSNGCKRRDSLSLSEPPKIKLTLNNSGKDTICVGSQVRLTSNVTGGVAPYSFVWNSGSTADSVIGVPMSTAAYSLSVTDSRNCPGDSQTYFIHVRDLMADTLDVTSNSPVCYGERVLVQGWHSGKYPPYSYSWSPFGDSSLGPLNKLLYKATSTILTVSDACGVSRKDSVYVDIHPLPLIELPDTGYKGCEPLSIIAINKLHEDDYDYSWDFGDGGVALENRPSYVYKAAGDYRILVTVINKYGCKVSNDGHTPVTVWPKPKAAFSLNKQTAKVNEASFRVEDLSLGSASNNWYLFDTIIGSGKVFEVVLDDTGNVAITLLAISEHGCLDTTSQNVLVTPDHVVKVPNAFNPRLNGGGGNGSFDPDSPDNQVFFPFVEHAEEYELMIFDRWGEMIFKSNDPKYGWDGYYKGELSPQDVYLWKLHVVFTDGLEKTMMGDITLLH